MISIENEGERSKRLTPRNLLPAPETRNPKPVNDEFPDLKHNDPFVDFLTKVHIPNVHIPVKDVRLTPTSE